MTHGAVPRTADHDADDAFLAALREPPRAAFAASLYLRLTAQEVTAISPSALTHSPDAVEAALPMRDVPRQFPRPRRWLMQSVGVVGAIALVLGVFAFSALLLRGHFAPAAIAPASVPATSAELLYPGRLAGRAGIIAVNADGSQERLLVEGDYFGVASSPDGHRFLAYGTTHDVSPSAIVDLYDATGQLLRSYALGATVPQIVYWSPDSQHAALLSRSGDATVWQGGKLQTWLLDDQGARELQLGAQTGVGTVSGTGAWSVDGRLLVGVIGADSNGDGQVGPSDAESTWTVGATGDDARKLYGGGLSLGWSGTGSSVYVVEPTRVLAIDDVTGQQRIIASAGEVGRQMQPATPADTARLPLSTFGTFPASALVAAPSGDRFALWLTTASAVGDTTVSPPYLVVIDQQGRVVGQDRPVAGAIPRFTAWAPDASRLAYSFTATINQADGVRVLTIGPGSPTSPASFSGLDASSAEGTSLRWSPDGRHLAFTSNGRAAVVGGEGLADMWVTVGTTGGWPNWQPDANR